MQSVRYKLVEFFIIYICLPVSFAFDYPFMLKVAFALTGFAYVIFVLVKVESRRFKIVKNIDWKSFIKHVFVKLLIIAFMTIVYMWFTSREDLFHVLFQKPKLWIIILFTYAMFSVYPQELIYRTMFFQRYQSLFKSRSLFILMNAVLFSLAHIFYKNPLVMLITFMGGVLFALTYEKTNSTFLVSIEHALYGCWLFTVGMGGMLGFPG